MCTISLELLVAVVDDRACLPRALQDADIGGRDVVEMFLVAGRRKELGLVEDAQELRHLADEIEEGGKTLDLLPRRVAGQVRSRMKRTMSMPIFGSN